MKELLKKLPNEVSFKIYPIFYMLEMLYKSIISRAEARLGQAGRRPEAPGPRDGTFFIRKNSMAYKKKFRKKITNKLQYFTQI